MPSSILPARPFDFAPLRGDPRRLARELARQGMGQGEIAAELIARFGTGDTSGRVGSNQWLGQLAGRATRERPALGSWGRGLPNVLLPEGLHMPAAPWRSGGYTYGVYVQLQDASGARWWRYMEVHSSTRLTKGELLTQAASAAVAFYSAADSDRPGGLGPGLKRTGRMNVVFAERGP